MRGDRKNILFPRAVINLKYFHKNDCQKLLYIQDYK